jgi:cellulose 1,4-beta-cellobiosidase
VFTRESACPKEFNEMILFRKLSGRRRVVALTGVGALVAGALIAVPSVAFAAPGCAVTYTANTWTESAGQGGFTASISLQNTGDPITSWNLQFSLPSGQTFTQGWSASYATSGTSITATNLSYNGTLATGASTSFGFNGRWTGAYSSPTAFTVNGNACGGTGGGGNTAPTVSLTSPASGASFTSGTAIPFAATASDNSAVARVEFLVDGTVVGTDTTSPYSFSAPGVAVGSHTAAARAVDNGTPALSTTTPTSPFTVTGTAQPTIIANPTTLTVASGASGTSNIRLAAAPTGNVTVTLTRAGSTAITATPSSITFTTANWQTGVNVTFAAATGTTAATSTFTAAATGYVSAMVSVTRSGSGGGGPRVDNPYVGAGVYNNPDWRARAAAEPGGSRIANQPTGVWIDRIAAIAGTTGAMGVRAHLNAALTQSNGQPFVVQFVIYDLPGRDCAALASNGELGPTEIGRYRTEYIDPIAAILADPAYASLRIVTIIEIDSLPNLVTNTNGRATATPQCDTMLQNQNYVNGVGSRSSLCCSS